MKGIIGFTEHFFWGMVWVFLLLIVGYAILHWVQSAGQGNVFGNAASWVTGAATP